MRGTPRRGAPRPPHSARAAGLVLGPHAHTTHARETQATGPGCPPEGRTAWRGKRLTPDTPHSDGRSTPGGGPPPPPRRANPHRGTHAKGRCRAPTPPGPRPSHMGDRHRLPAPRTGSRQRESARPQTPLAAARGTPQGRPSATRTARRNARCGNGRVMGSHDHTTCAQETRATARGLSPRRPPAAPAAHNAPQGTRAKGAGAGPHTRTHAPTASGQRVPTRTARPEDGQPGEDERLASGAPQDGTRDTPNGCPPDTPTARRSAHAVGPLLGPHAHTARTRDAGVLAARSRDRRPGRESA